MEDLKEITAIADKPKVVLFFDEDTELSMESLEVGMDEDLFGDDEEVEQEEENKDADDNVDPESIFGGDSGQENVGEDKDKEMEEPDESDKDAGSSPKTFYSSALKALKDDGVLPDLEDDFITKVKTPEEFAEAIEKQVAARMSESERRIKEALDNNASIDEIKKFENALGYLDSINDDLIESDSDEGETIRRQIIYQDFINKGFKPERAEKEVNKSFNGGTDIDDAKAALESNKEYFKDEYDNLIEERKKSVLAQKKAKEEELKSFQKKVLETEKPFGILVDKQTRQKIYENAAKPVHKDKDGKVMTTVQKYTKENPLDAEYFFSMFYTMTDGFKNLDKFIGQKVRASSKSALRDLENKIKNVPLNGDGTVDFGFGKDDQDSFASGKLKLNI